MKNRKQLLRQIILASLLAAMTTVLTYYIKIPTQNGYLHIGDSIIYIAACLLPTPLAMLCGALGGAFADLLGGYTMYALPSLIIKALLALSFDSRQKRIVSKRNVLASVTGAVITAAGYYLAEAVIITLSSAADFSQFKNIIMSPVPWGASLYTLPGNLVQAAASAAVFLILGTALDKAKVKQRIINH